MRPRSALCGADSPAPWRARVQAVAEALLAQLQAAGALSPLAAARAGAEDGVLRGSGPLRPEAALLWAAVAEALSDEAASLGTGAAKVRARVGWVRHRLRADGREAAPARGHDSRLRRLRAGGWGARGGGGGGRR